MKLETTSIKKAIFTKMIHSKARRIHFPPLTFIHCCSIFSRLSPAVIVVPLDFVAGLLFLWKDQTDFAAAAAVDIAATAAASEMLPLQNRWLTHGLTWKQMKRKS